MWFLRRASNARQLRQDFVYSCDFTTNFIAPQRKKKKPPAVASKKKKKNIGITYNQFEILGE